MNAKSARIPLFGVLLAANLAAIAAAAIVFRCRSLSNIPGLNGDEAWYGVRAWEMLHGGDFSLRTPTGNLLNPLMFIPAVLLHACFRPSVFLLRIAPLLSGLAALAVNWAMCRRIFDRATAVISTLILLLLPIDIAYSRFAWDAGQSLLATLPVWLFSLAAVRFPARRDAATAAAIVCLLAAVLVHPTNIFAAAAIAASTASGWRRQRLDRRRLAFWAVAALALLVWGTCLIKTHSGGHWTDRLRQLVLPGECPHFSVSYANLFTGETVYQYIAGSHSWLRWPAFGSCGQIGVGAALVWTILLAAAWRLGMVPVLARQKQGRPPGDRRPLAPTELADRVLVAAWILELAGFLALAGPWAMVPGQERYAICLIAPAVLLVARGAAVWQAKAGRLKMPAAVLACVLAWLALADFRQHYFAFIEQTGGRAHPTFRTAAIEPKLAALNYVLHRRAAGVAWIAADSWWSYYPLKYFALGDPNVCIVTFKEAVSAPKLRWLRRKAARGASNSATRPRSKSGWARRFSGMGRASGFSTSAVGPCCRSFACRARSRRVAAEILIRRPAIRGPRGPGPGRFPPASAAALRGRG